MRTDILALRKHLGVLAAGADRRLPRRYALWHPPGQPPTLCRRARRIAGRVLRWLHLLPVPVSEPWRAGLKHVGQGVDSKAVLIWALGVKPDELRLSCQALQALFVSLPGWAPVLITDVADFAFYSRLGWLVEFVPSLTGPGSDYQGQKLCYLAWRYREAPAIPLSAGLAPDLRREDLLLE